MRVLHVTGRYPTPAQPQAGCFIETQVESLRKKGVRIEVCVIPGRGPGKYVRGIGFVQKAIQAFAPEIVHAHYTYSGWTARVATRLPLVVSFMGGDVQGVPGKDGRVSLGNAAAHLAASRALARTADWNITKSEALARQIGVKNLEVIPNGLDLELFKPKTVERARLGLREKCRYILFAGRFDDPFKGHALAQAAVAHLRAREELEFELIELHGKTQSEVADYLNAVDCLLMTSVSEGSPNIVKEALACGLPVVSVPVGDVEERLRGVDACAIVPRDPGAIGQALAPILRARVRSREGRSRVSSLGLDTVAERLIRRYRAVLVP